MNNAERLFAEKTEILGNPVRFNGEDDGCGYCSLYQHATYNGFCSRGEQLNFDKCGVA
jgi:hypothetical protein